MAKTTPVTPPCAVDTLYSLEIPEGVDLQAELAGFVPRALAYLIDFSIRALILLILLIVSAWFDKVGQGIWLIAFFLLEWLYPVVFEIYRDGQTIGKKYMGIKVVAENLVAVELQSSLIRNLLRVADFLPTFYVFGLLSMIISGKFQRLGDLAAGTLVVYAPTQKALAASIPDVEAIAPPFPLNAKQQMAIIEFSQNQRKLSGARQQELANVLKDVLPPSDVDPVTYLKGIGKWLLGER